MTHQEHHDATVALAGARQELADAADLVGAVERRRQERRASEKVACPSCGHLRSLVVPYHQTAADQRSGAYVRRRACYHCTTVYETTESVGRIIAAPEESSELRNI